MCIGNRKGPCCVHGIAFEYGHKDADETHDDHHSAKDDHRDAESRMRKEAKITGHDTTLGKGRGSGIEYPRDDEQLERQS